MQRAGERARLSNVGVVVTTFLCKVGILTPSLTPILAGPHLHLTAGIEGLRTNSCRSDNPPAVILDVQGPHIIVVVGGHCRLDPPIPIFIVSGSPGTRCVFRTRLITLARQKENDRSVLFVVSDILEVDLQSFTLIVTNERGVVDFSQRDLDRSSVGGAPGSTAIRSFHVVEIRPPVQTGFRGMEVECTANPLCSQCTDLVVALLDGRETTPLVPVHAVLARDEETGPVCGILIVSQKRAESAFRALPHLHVREVVEGN